MDFRENWLMHFRAAVDKEAAELGGLPAAYAEVGRQLEKGKDTIYQHYAQKSGKVYPTIEMMVMLEKKYGEGRPSGWSSKPSAVGLDAAEADEFAQLCGDADAETRRLALAAAKAVFDEAAARREQGSALQRAEQAISELSDDEAMLLYARLTGPAVDDGEVERRMPVTRKAGVK